MKTYTTKHLVITAIIFFILGLIVATVVANIQAARVFAQLETAEKEALEAFSNANPNATAKDIVTLYNNYTENRV